MGQIDDNVKNPIHKAIEVTEKVLHEQLDNLLALLKADVRQKRVHIAATQVVTALGSINLIPPNGSNIGAEVFPKQSRIGDRVEVSFLNARDQGKLMYGEIVRSDNESPFMVIIRLEDGRHLLTRECVWKFAPLTKTVEEQVIEENQKAAESDYHV